MALVRKNYDVLQRERNEFPDVVIEKVSHVSVQEDTHVLR